MCNSNSAEKNLSALDKEIIKVLQGDFPLCEEPYKVLAEKVGISEEEFLRRVKSFVEEKKNPQDGRGFEASRGGL